MRCIEEDTDTTTSRFEFREIGPNYPGLYRPNMYEMTREEVLEDISKNNQSYEIVEHDGYRLTGSLDPNLVYKAADHPHIVDATLHHFNGIQRGEFHPRRSNTINPNSHGKNINVLSEVKNTFKSNHHSKKNSIDVLSKVKNTFNNSKGDKFSPSSSHGHSNGHASSSSYSQGSKDDDDSETHRPQVNLPQPNGEMTKASDMPMRGRGIRSPLDQFIIRS